MRILSSPRRRRRLAFVAIAAGIAGPLIFLGVRYSTPGSKGDATGPDVQDSFYDQPKHVPFTPTKQRAVRHVLARFISTAVAREDVGESWGVSGPTLRQGFTRRQWSTGDIPVTPFPAARHGQGAWDVVQYSYPRQVGLEVLVFPKAGSGYSVATADVDVVKGHDGRWRVDYWMIKKFHGPPSVVKPKPGSAKHHARPKPRAAEPALAEPKPVDRTWIAFPLALLGLAVVLPVGIGIHVWIRNRRAAAAYHRSR